MPQPLASDAGDLWWAKINNDPSILMSFDDLELYHFVFTRMLGRGSYNGDACVAVSAVLFATNWAWCVVQHRKRNGPNALMAFLHELRLVPDGNPGQ